MATAISEGDLRQALRDQRLEFHYQPQVSLVTGKLIGAEALLRLRNGDGELVLPGSFLPAAEKSGMVRELTYAMFDRFVEEANLIHDLHDDLLLSMNFSALDIDNSDLLDKVARWIRAQPGEQSLIGIELTETAALDILGLKNLHRYAELGVPFIMDDFGTGFANLASLSDSPFTKIKLDKSLIDTVRTDARRAVIVKDNIRMAHRLGMDVMAEGVEDAETFRFLQNIGCTGVQGFFIARPMPLKELLVFLKEKQRGWHGTPLGLLHLAQLDHIEWRKALFDDVFQKKRDDREGALFEEHVINPRRCMLGQWYYGPGRFFEELPEYQALEGPHNDIHLLGHQLITEASKRQPSQEQLLTLARQLTEVSVEVLLRLQSLETRFLSEGSDNDSLQAATGAA